MRYNDHVQHLLLLTYFLSWQNPDYRRSTYCMLVVDRDIVRMSDFVKEKTGMYEKGQVFYEFAQEEDLPYCRKILQLTEPQVKFIPLSK